jgi:hypothetical protein
LDVPREPWYLEVNPVCTRKPAARKHVAKLLA